MASVIFLLISTLVLQVHSSSQACCGELFNNFPSIVYFQNSTEYNSTLYSYYTAQEVSIHPTCFFTPDSATDISVALPIISRDNCLFAIKSGGHGIPGGAANIQNGVSIDLSKFNTLEILPGNDTVVRIGVGMKWGEVYEILDAQGIAVPGGRWGGVGVGGLALGGGISFFSTRVGFVCDNIVNAQVVLASGAVVNANASSNPELWRALKGGSNNFGIVTHIDLLAFPQGNFWGGEVITPWSSAAQGYFIDALHSYSSNTTFDENSSLIFSYSYNSGSWIFISVLEYTQQEGYPSTLGPFITYEPESQIENTMKVSNLSDFAITNSATDGPNGATRNYYFTRTYLSSPVLIQKIYEIYNETVSNTIPLITEDVSWSVTAEPFPPALTQRGDKKGGNVLGLHAAEGPLILWLATVFWHDPANDAIIAQTIEEYWAKIDALAKDMGLYNEFSYLNYAAPTQSVIEGYGSENVAFLKNVSRKYDPESVFQRLVPGGFKLGV